MKFRMVDRILSWEPKTRIRGVKTVSFEEYNLKAPFAEEPRLPETLVLESLFQLGNWLIVLSSDFTRMGLVARTERVTFDGSLRPGSHLMMELNVRSYREDGILFDGVATIGDEQIASGKGCLAVPAPLSDYHDPDDLRMLFSEIYRPNDA